MTRDRDALAIICTALTGAILLVAAVILSTRPAPAADDAQSFWRETTAAPRKARRIMVTYRLHRSARNRIGSDARETNKSRLGTRASGSVHAQLTPTDDDVDSFARRVVLPPPLRELFIPPNLMQRDEPLPILTPPSERREPSNNRRRELCVAAAIVVAVLTGVTSAVVSQRGAAHHV